MNLGRWRGKSARGSVAFSSQPPKTRARAAAATSAPPATRNGDTGRGLGASHHTCWTAPAAGYLLDSGAKS